MNISSVNIFIRLRAGGGAAPPDGGFVGPTKGSAKGAENMHITRTFVHETNKCNGLFITGMRLIIRESEWNLKTH